MLESAVYENVKKIQRDLTAIFESAIVGNMAALKITMDEEIEQEIRERIAVLVFDEIVNDLPFIPYLAIWEDGANEIFHAYMSPKIETISGYTAEELQRIGYINIVRGEIVSFYRELDNVEEKRSPISVAKEKRVAGFQENKNWQGCYQVEKKDGGRVWVIDRSTITRFRNTTRDNIICLSSGILVESTELLEKREKNR